MIHTDSEDRSPQRIEGCVLNLSDSTRWTVSEHDVPSHGSALVGDSSITITVKNDARDYWQYLTTEVEVDLDRTPILNVEVPECLSAWSIKVAPLEAESARDDIELITENSNVGVFHVNVANATGWGGASALS